MLRREVTAAIPDRPRIPVTTLELLTPAPAGISSATVSETGVLSRHGAYVIWSDPDRGTDAVWTAAGVWVGTAAHPDTATHLITHHQRTRYRDR